MIQHYPRQTLAAAAALLIAGCGGGSDNTTPAAPAVTKVEVLATARL